MSFHAKVVVASQKRRDSLKIIVVRDAGRDAEALKGREISRTDEEVSEQRRTGIIYPSPASVGLRCTNI